MTYSEALDAMDNGFCVSRSEWSRNFSFVYKQVPNIVEIDTIPLMTSMPDSAKKILVNRNKPLKFENQITIVGKDNVLTSWIANPSDTFAKDWFIVDTDWINSLNNEV